MTESTADKFCRVLAMLQVIKPGIEDPLRHQKRNVRNIAFQLIDNALTQAEQLAWVANDMAETISEDSRGGSITSPGATSSDERGQT